MEIQGLVLLSKTCHSHSCKRSPEHSPQMLQSLGGPSESCGGWDPSVRLLPPVCRPRTPCLWENRTFNTLPVLPEGRDHWGREDADSTQWEDPTNHWAALEASLEHKGSSDLCLMVEQLRRTTSEDERVSGNSRYGVKPTLPKFNTKPDSDGFVMYDC